MMYYLLFNRDNNKNSITNIHLKYIFIYIFPNLIDIYNLIYYSINQSKKRTQAYFISLITILNISGKCYFFIFFRFFDIFLNAFKIFYPTLPV